MRTIQSPEAPAPAGHYSQAVVHAGTVYVAGQLGVDPADPDADLGDAATQTKQALANVSAVLAAGGSGLGRVLSVTVFITDIALWPEVNRAFAEVMGDHRPARAIVPVGSFGRGRLIEIQAIAAEGDESS